jgi:hypothetical protein
VSSTGLAASEINGIKSVLVSSLVNARSITTSDAGAVCLTVGADEWRDFVGTIQTYCNLFLIPLFVACAPAVRCNNFWAPIARRITWNTLLCMGLFFEKCELSDESGSISRLPGRVKSKLFVAGAHRRPGQRRFGLPLFSWHSTP